MSEWEGTGAAYAVSFAGLTGGVASAVMDEIGVHVAAGTLLDVGAGSGALTAEAIARGFEVSAAEPEPSMRTVLRAAFPSIEVSAGALPSLGFADASFDVVTANFVLNHVESPRAAARELFRVTRPGGVVAATIWPQGASPLRPVWEAMATTVGEPLGTALPPVEDFPRSAEGLVSLFTDAGARDVATTTPAWTWQVSSGSLWTAVEGGIASIGNLYRRVGPSAKQRIRASFDDHMAALAGASTGDETIDLPHRAILAVGRR